MFEFLNCNDNYKIKQIATKNKKSYDETKNNYVNCVYKKMKSIILNNNILDNLDTLRETYISTNLQIETLGVDIYIANYSNLKKFDQLCSFNDLILSYLYISLSNHDYPYEDVIEKYDIPNKDCYTQNIYTALTYLINWNYNISELELLYREKMNQMIINKEIPYKEINDYLITLCAIEQITDLIYEQEEDIDANCIYYMLIKLKYDELLEDELQNITSHELANEEGCYIERNKPHYDKSNILHIVQMSKKVLDHKNTLIELLPSFFDETDELLSYNNDVKMHYEKIEESIYDYYLTNYSTEHEKD